MQNSKAVETPLSVEFEGVRDLRLRSRDQRPPVDDEMLIEVTAVGVCGTDLSQWRDAEGPTPPRTVIGHEFGGRILELGPQAHGWSIGQFVAIDPNITCEDCEKCAQGLRALCAQRRLLGRELDGGMRTHLTISSRQAVGLPDGVDPRAVALVEPVAVGVHAVGRSGIGPGDRVGVIGGGAIGAACARVAVEIGANPVLIEPDADRRDRLRVEGFQAYGGAAEDRSTWGAVIDTVGITATVDAASDHVVRGSTICIVGLAHGSPLPPAENLVRRELTLRGSFCYTTDELKTAADIVGAHGLAAIPVDTVDGFADAPTTIAELAVGGLRAGKTVFLP